MKVQGWLCNECGAENIDTSTPSPFEEPPKCVKCGAVQIALVYCQIEIDDKEFYERK